MFVFVIQGPGGFCEFIILNSLSQIQSSCTGYGISLKLPLNHSCNWNLKHLNITPQSVILYKSSDTDISSNNIHEATCKFTIVNENCGDICKLENLNAIVNSIKQDAKFNNVTILDSRSENDDWYVDFVSGDGGFESFGNERENESNNIILCQIVGMLKVLKRNGNFILKIFSCHLRQTKDMIILLYKLFHTIIISKPKTSRCTSSERYIVCKYFIQLTELEREDIICQLWSNKAASENLFKLIDNINSDNNNAKRSINYDDFSSDPNKKERINCRLIEEYIVRRNAEIMQMQVNRSLVTSLLYRLKIILFNRMYICT
jgi:23S rRNA U2552 (ribose-2'-O)-methylase RlmE/FtsJ